MYKPTLLTIVLLAACSWVKAQAPSVSGYIDRDTKRSEVVVFVHGVTGDARGTWTNENTRAYWPALVRDDPTFSNANVWVFSYHSPALNNAQNVEELATKLADELRAQDVLTSHERAYFIVHSMGGLIAREMLAQQLPPPEKVPLIYFFGTPSAGADLAGVVAAVSANPQFSNLRPFTRETAVASYSRRWLATAENPKARYPQRIWSFCAYEIEPFAAGRLIVSTSSASFLCSTSPRASLANHVTMVKPSDRSSEPYQYFVSAYKFAHEPTAKFIASADAITMHSVKSPGLRIEGLELRMAKFSADPINVGCNQVETGIKKLQLSLDKTERVLAVKSIFNVLTNVQSSSVNSTFDQSGSVFVDYRVQGKNAGVIQFLCPPGKADIGIQYLVEKR
jgi:pimeloyl-ACP methyl ester carboxylesterase